MVAGSVSWDVALSGVELVSHPLELVVRPITQAKDCEFGRRGTVARPAKVELNVDANDVHPVRQRPPSSPWRRHGAAALLERGDDPAQLEAFGFAELGQFVSVT